MPPKPFESKIQDLVYNMDVGIGARLIKVGLYILFIGLVLLLYSATQFRGFKEAGAMDQAQLARNLMRHKALVTQCVHPASIGYLERNNKTVSVMEHPDILHPPLYPTLLAGLFKVSGTEVVASAETEIFSAEKWIIGLGNLCVLLTGMMLYVMGKRFFSKRVALLAVTLYVLSDLVWRDAISGLSISFLTLLTTALFFTALTAVSRQSTGQSFPKWIIPPGGLAPAGRAGFFDAVWRLCRNPRISPLLRNSVQEKRIALGLGCPLDLPGGGLAMADPQLCRKRGRAGVVSGHGLERFCGV